MKASLYKTLFLFGSLSLFTASCKKDDASPTVSNDEAANALGDVLTVDFSGSTSDASSVSTQDAAGASGRTISFGRTLATTCGVQKDTTLTRTSLAGALITYSYTANLTYTMACTGFVPSSLDLTLSTSGSRTGIKVSSTGSSTGSYALTGFSQSNYTLNGTFTRTETITEIAGQKSFTGTSELTITNVTIDKSTKVIQGGTATYTMSGAITGGSSYSHTGTITFNGGGSATLTVSGTSYTVNLVTGTVIKS
jgi:hypothetical protein